RCGHGDRRTRGTDVDRTAHPVDRPETGEREGGGRAGRDAYRGDLATVVRIDVDLPRGEDTDGPARDRERPDGALRADLAEHAAGHGPHFDVPQSAYRKGVRVRQPCNEQRNPVAADRRPRGRRGAWDRDVAPDADPDDTTVSHANLAFPVGQAVVDVDDVGVVPGEPECRAPRPDGHRRVRCP